MHPVWAQRRKEVLSDCLVSPDVFTQMGPTLAKGDFLAKYSRSAIQSSEKSARYTGQNTRNAALSGREVCTMRRLRSFEHTGGSNQDERAVETGQNAWSNRQNELVVSVLALWW